MEDPSSWEKVFSNRIGWISQNHWNIKSSPLPACQAERLKHNLDFKNVDKITEGSLPLNEYLKNPGFTDKLCSFIEFGALQFC